MKNRHHNKTIRGESLEDRIGKYIGVCSNPAHPGIVRYSYYRICEKRHCANYIRYRPEK